MANLHEYVHYTDGLPMRVFVHNQPYVPPHWHKEVEVLLVLSGSLLVIVGELRFRADEGDVIIFNTNEIHSTAAPPNDPPPITMGMQVAPEACTELLPGIVRTRFRNLAFAGSTTENHSEDWIRYYLARILWEAIEGREGHKIAIHGIGLLVMSYLARNCVHSIAASRRNENSKDELSLLRPVFSYVDKHYMDKLSLREIASTLSISVSHLCHFFKRQVGISVTEYIADVRLSRARDLLLFSDQKIIDIVYSCGFSGPAYFYKKFKEKQRCTPLEFRRASRTGVPVSRAATRDASRRAPSESAPQIDDVVARLFIYLGRLHEDRIFTDQDRRSLLTTFHQKNPKHLRVFSNIHFQSTTVMPQLTTN